MRENESRTVACISPSRVSSRARPGEFSLTDATPSAVRAVSGLRDDPWASQEALLSLMEASRAAAESESME